jgi:hypothetical protein
MLRALDDACPTSLHGTVTIEAGWLRSVHPALVELGGVRGGGSEQRQAVQAVDHNRALCERGLAAKYALARGSCAITIAGAICVRTAHPHNALIGRSRGRARRRAHGNLLVSVASPSVLV